MKGYRRYIALIVLLFGALLLLEYFRPKEVDWSQTFSREDKIPYGTYALYELLPGLFPDQEVRTIREPLYNLLQDSTVSGNYISISQVFEADSLDTDKLLDFVHRGNQAFIAASYFTSSLIDTLHFDAEEFSSSSPDSTGLYLTSHPARTVASMPGKQYQSYLVVDEVAGHVALGRNRAGYLTLMKVPFGKGWFYISSTPLAFTNYQLLTRNQSTYAATALSHLPVKPVLWDEYQKSGREEDQSVLRVLMRYEPLTWAYYLSLFGIILFLVFKSKRTQRVIPVIEPPRNSTVDFVKTIGSLYFNYGNHKNIAEKKITFFLEFLRLHYHVSTHTLDNELRERVITKSGANKELINTLFGLIQSIQQSKAIGAQTLMMLNTHLEDFYRQTSIRPKAKV